MAAEGRFRVAPAPEPAEVALPLAALPVALSVAEAPAPPLSVAEGEPPVADAEAPPGAAEPLGDAVELVVELAAVALAMNASKVFPVVGALMAPTIPFAQ